MVYICIVAFLKNVDDDGRSWQWQQSRINFQKVDNQTPSKWSTSTHRFLVVLGGGELPGTILPYPTILILPASP